MVLIIPSILWVHAKLNWNYWTLPVFYSTQRLELWNLEKVEPNSPNLSAKNQVILLYDSQTSNSKSLNKEIIRNVISYLKATTCFDILLTDF